MESTNTFNSGMSSDFSKQIPKKDSYIQALNFRGTTTLGDSTEGLVNVKGNHCAVTYPNIYAVYKLTSRLYNPNGNNDNISITINSYTTSVANVTQNNLLNVYNALKDLPNCYNNPNAQEEDIEFAIATDGRNIVIYQNPIYRNCGPEVESSPLYISFNSQYGSNSKYSLGWINTNEESVSIFGSAAPYVTNSNQKLITIGSTSINDEIYLLAADNIELIPDPDSNLHKGYIFKLEIDEITKESKLTILYIGKLNFTKFHPIAPSAIIGRYESDNIKRIYFSDNYNSIKSVNVADSNLMVNPINKLSLGPSVGFSQPILGDLINGSLKTGVYQFSYRLIDNNGKTSNYSQLSELIYLASSGNITRYTSSGDFINYKGTAPETITDKGFKIKIDNLDINYNYIELVVLYRTDDTDGVKYLKTFPTKQINGSSISYNIITSLEEDVTLLELDINEFLSIKSNFTHAKTVEEKGNRLFWGNIKSNNSAIINFDARAFRASSPATQPAATIKLKNNGSIGTYTLPQAISLPEQSDCINEYYNDNTGDISTNSCHFKPDNSGYLGGIGANIEYEFGTFSILMDETLIPATPGKTIQYIPSHTPYRTIGSPSPSETPGGNLEFDVIYDFQQWSSVSTPKYPQNMGLLKGYQHEEIYRFGIELFDKKGSESFVKWIGDIKFPTYANTNNNPDPHALANGVNDFRLTYKVGNNLYGQVLYIKFKVNLTSIKDSIGGYQIVRAERDSIANRTILGCGMVNPFKVITDSESNAYLGLELPSTYSEEDTDNFIPSSWYSWCNLNTAYPETSTMKRYKSFDCFDFISNKTRFKTLNNDRLYFRGGLLDSNWNKSNTAFIQTFGSSLSSPTHTVTGGDIGGTEYYFLKMYQSSNIFVDYKLTNGDYVTAGSDITLGTTKIYNWASYDGGGTVAPDLTKKSCNGIDTQIVQLANSGVDLYTDYDCIANGGNVKKILALYYRPNPNQYGGSDYLARTNSTYIKCSNYIPVYQNNSAVNYNNLELKVMGGDVYTCYVNMQKTNKPFMSPLPTNERGRRNSVTFYYPATTMANAELRNNTNSTLQNIPFTDPDDNTYFRYYSAEDNIRKFYQKPNNFTENNKWINRIWFSQAKINNELSDSWTQYLTNDKYDIEGNFGEITWLGAMNSNLYCIQDRSVALISVNPVIAIPTEQGFPIELSSGKVIQTHIVIRTNIGSKHQWSISKSFSQIVFLDIRNKKLYSFDGKQITPLSITKGQNNFIIKRLHGEILNNDNPIINKGILSVYDLENSEFIFTFLNTNSEQPDLHDEKYTISYNELKDNFGSMYSFTPNIYITNNKFLLSSYSETLKDEYRSLWLHNHGEYGKFYNTYHPSTIKLLLNENPLNTKVLDNLSWYSQEYLDSVEWSDDKEIRPGAQLNPTFPDDIYSKQTFNSIRVYNDYQNTNVINLNLVPPNNNLRFIEQQYNLQVPRNKVDYDNNNPNSSEFSIFNPLKLSKTEFGERLRDKWFIVDLNYFNSDRNRRFIINSLNYKYRISNR